MKKNYNQPNVECVELKGTQLMLTVSVQENGGGGGVANAPAKRGVE